jgi:predicted small metal-binding protein
MGLNCSYFIKGENLEEVVNTALQHVREKHANDFNSIHTPAEIEQMKQSLARSTRILTK